MKTVLMTLLTMSFILMTFIGCDLFATEKTYSITSAGICIEITTDDKDLQNAAEDGGYKEEPCSSTDLLGYCKEMSEFEGDSFDAYFYSPEYTAETAALFCGITASTWVAK